MSKTIAEVAAPRTPPISISSKSTEVNHTGSWKYIRPVYRDASGPCQHACPTGIDIPAYMALVRDGRLDDACELILRDNPIPAVTGRVCDHPCEKHCNRAHFDEAVSVHAVERVLGDRILASPLPQASKMTQPEAVAIIGSGPAGLACAYHLNRAGYRVEIFEQDEQPGGMLRAGIPEFRLPRDVLDAQIERLRALGIRIHCGFRVGLDVQWEALTNEFAAIFIGTGAHISRQLDLRRPLCDSVWSGLDFLRLVNHGERPHIGARVVVIGGGNTAMDCARTAVRMGAEVTVAYRRTRADMPALPDEIEDADHEGVRFLFLAAPSELSVRGADLRVTFEPMTLGAPDASGRRSPVRDDTPPFSLECDTVITAIGEDPELDMLPDGVVAAVDEWGASQVANIFLGGDVASTHRTVAAALGSGKRAAFGIDRYLRSCRTNELSDSTIDGDCDVVDVDDLNFNHLDHSTRHHDRHTDFVLPFTETNVGLLFEDAMAEAGRCFECGNCNSCELCLIYCADAAIVRGTDGTRFDILLDYCKGCGVCAAECPRGAIVMTREGL